MIPRTKIIILLHYQEVVITAKQGIRGNRKLIIVVAEAASKQREREKLLASYTLCWDKHHTSEQTDVKSDFNCPTNTATVHNDLFSYLPSMICHLWWTIYTADSMSKSLKEAQI